MMTKETTVGELVAKNFRNSAVFRKYGIDFCCGGKRTLSEACEKSGLSPEQVLSEIASLPGQAGNTEDYLHWEAGFLATYIVNVHHSYVKATLPEMRALAEKVANVHGGHHEPLNEMLDLVHVLEEEMLAHMDKEEHILFPYIRALESFTKTGFPVPKAHFGSVEHPIACMIEEHETAGGIMQRLEEMTDGFTPPAGACTSWRLYYKYLAAFQEDLHKHVHLENNILFPKAGELEAEAEQASRP